MIGVETFTPEQAEAALERRLPNRRLSDARAARIADDIRSGRYDLNGETIIFDAEDRLLDGQHRLRACVMAGRSITTYVVRGVARSATLDSGKGRTGGNVLQIAGHDRGTTLAAALRYPWLHASGLLSNAEALRKLRPTHREIEALLAAHPDIERCVAVCVEGTGGLLRRACFPGLYCVTREANQRLSDAFFVPLAEGTTLRATAPAYWIRRRVEADRGRARSTMTDVQVVAMLIAAWNAHAAGRAITKAALDASREPDEIVLPPPSFAQMVRRP